MTYKKTVEMYKILRILIIKMVNFTWKRHWCDGSPIQLYHCTEGLFQCL